MAWLHKKLVYANTKAEISLEGIFFALNFLPWEFFLIVKKLEIKKTKTTYISALKSVY